MKTGRIAELDLLKAVGMFMVIGIHVFPYVYDMPHHFLYQLFLLLADPLFFYASGFVFKTRDYKKNKFRFFLNEFKLLFLFVFYTFLIILIKGEEVSFLAQAIINPHKSLWFLISLFFLRLFAFISSIISHFFFRKKWELTFFISFVALIITSLIVVIFVGDYFDFGHLVYYSSFFFLGMLTKTLNIKSFFEKNKHLYAFFTVLTSLLFFTFYITCLLTNTLFNYSMIHILLRLLTSTFGVFFLFFVSIRIAKYNSIEKIGLLLGECTLASYFFHSFYLLLIDKYFELHYYHDGVFFHFLIYYLCLLLLTLASSFIIIFLKKLWKIRSVNKIFFNKRSL